MNKKIAGVLIGTLLLGTGISFAQEKPKNLLKNGGINIQYEDDSGEEKSVNIQRRPDAVCAKVNGGDPENVWGGDYANKTLPNPCTKTYLTTMGKITPMNMEDGIETYGELEVIDFIQKNGKNPDALLVDARMEAWYKKRTIPTAINIPFKKFDPKNVIDFEFVLDTIGVEKEGKKYNFENAKTLLLFCNGAWCPQSSWAMENLRSIGYPKEKLKWYRAGMYGWTIVNLTTVVPE